MNTFFSPARLRILAGLFTNLAAGWIGAAIIVPTVSGLSPFNVVVNIQFFPERLSSRAK